ncbi:glycosyltransferase family 4 protein [Flavobacterium sp. LHD-80]|uniref:glycosyltransferase family 4 protein n=1 Tax=Flavobacterium sp. LHD-80 TaxID=3071411 RepID=UPI0027DEF16B|nr:glycosyltransferase family 4 protein [Flavobacterium sp. LHD-80]MDQ6471028.1 glycosyltransferase family 4 protein [Flavobacterium sp. LHD-80]
MKILIIHSHYLLRGGEDAVVDQEALLLKQLHEVEILHFQNKRGLKGGLQFLGSLWNVFSAKKVKRKILEFQPDVVHVHNWHFASGPLIFRTINRLKIPVIHTIHNYRLLCPSAILLHKDYLFTDSLSQSFPWKAIVNRVYRSSFFQTFWLAFIVWFHKKIGTWKKIDCYICLTSFAVELFQKSNFGIEKKKFVVKPNFTSIPIKTTSLEKEEYFLFVGRLSNEKGISVLLNAFKDTLYSLKIAGDGQLKEKVLDVAKKNNNITYLGNLKREEVLLELQKATALIFPSIWYEGMPMTILEAFSCKTPIIASNLGATSSMITDGVDGFHFEVGNVDSLRQTIKYFFELPEEMKVNLQKNAYKKFSKEYDSNLQIEYFNSIFCNILN